MEKNNSVVEIERALIGLILVNKKSINNIRGYITSEDFYDFKNAIIFQTINEVLDEGYEIEIAPIIAKLKANKQFEKIGGEIYLSQIIQESGISSNTNKYIKEIVDKAQLRKVAKIIKDLQKEIQESTASADSLLEKVEQSILSSTRDIKQKDFEIAKKIVNDAISEIEKKASYEGVSGIPSEFPSLDKMTSGFQDGDLVIIAARPSMGKTAFALNLASSIAKDKNVALFSLEMPSIQIINRFLSFNGYIESNKLREPSKLQSNEWTKLHLAKDRISKLNLYIDDSAGIKLSELVWKAKKLHKNIGLDIIIIDYLQLLSVASYKNENRQIEVSIISRTLKKLARELNIPVIALSQLSRKVEQRENKRPMMSDLRESGAIEQDADLIAFLYRDAYYNKEEDLNSTHQETDIIISKHRNGPIGNIKLSFNPTLGLFTDLIGDNK